MAITLTSHLLIHFFGGKVKPLRQEVTFRDRSISGSRTYEQDKLVYLAKTVISIS